jgi:hypothetical protein
MRKVHYLDHCGCQITFYILYFIKNNVKEKTRCCVSEVEMSPLTAQVKMSPWKRRRYSWGRSSYRGGI